MLVQFHLTGNTSQAAAATIPRWCQMLKLANKSVPLFSIMVAFSAAHSHQTENLSPQVQGTAAHKSGVSINSPHQRPCGRDWDASSSNTAPMAKCCSPQTKSKSVSGTHVLASHSERFFHTTLKSNKFRSPLNPTL